MKLIWEFLGRKAPAENQKRRSEFLKAIQKLWLAGALGALFFSIARNLPVHLPMILCNPNWETFAILLKYMFIVWFVAYFMISAMDNEQAGMPHRDKDIIFDLFQSTSALVAAYFLGFVITLDNPEDNILKGYAWALAVIMAICLTSYHYFEDEARDGVNSIRICGFCLASYGLVFCGLFQESKLSLYISLLIIQVLLLFLLFIYLKIGFDEPPKEIEKMNSSNLCLRVKKYFG